MPDLLHSADTDMDGPMFSSMHENSASFSLHSVLSTRRSGAGLFIFPIHPFTVLYDNIILAYFSAGRLTVK